MKQPVILVCGVSGSGKSWVCRQVADRFHYVAHDEHFKNHPEVIIDTCKKADKPVITESPFGERVLREQLERAGVRVIPYFVVEHPRVVQQRYLQREGKVLPKAALTRATTIIDRANEWNAPKGTSSEILNLLRGEIPALVKPF